jgi:hypothetical protein
VDSLVALPEVGNELSGIKGGSQLGMEFQEVPGLKWHRDAEKKRMISRHKSNGFRMLKKRGGLMGREHGSHAEEEEAGQVQRIQHLEFRVTLEARISERWANPNEVNDVPLVVTTVLARTIVSVIEALKKVISPGTQCHVVTEPLSMLGGKGGECMANRLGVELLQPK